MLFTILRKGVLAFWSLNSRVFLARFVLAERGAGRYQVDIIMTGGTTGNQRLVPNGVPDPIGPELFLPEVLDKSEERREALQADPE